MRFNAKVTIGSFEGRKLIYNKIISRPPPRSASAIVCTILLCLSGIYFRVFRLFVKYYYYYYYYYYCYYYCTCIIIIIIIIVICCCCCCYYYTCIIIIIIIIIILFVVLGLLFFLFVS